MDRSVLAFERWLQAFQTTQQELRLGTYAIGEVIDTVVRQIENSLGHVTPRSWPPLVTVLQSAPCIASEGAQLSASSVLAVGGQRKGEINSRVTPSVAILV